MRIPAVLGLLGLFSTVSPAHAGFRDAIDAGQAAIARLIAHSHNDYSGRTPLVDALNHRFDSVEADIWLVGGRLLVSHMGFVFRGELEALYLDPLQKRVDAQGSVHGDGKPFYLWLDLKADDPGLLDTLHATLSRYPMLTTFTDEAIRSAPVTVILSGKEKLKNEYVSRFAERRACRDSNRYDFRDPPGDTRWSWYSLNWSDHFSWPGSGPMPEQQKLLLKTMVRAIHEKKRRVRFWNAPETHDFWKAAEEAGVDAIGTDFISKLASFLGLPQPQPRPTLMRSLAGE